MELKEIQTSQLHSDAFTMIGKEWMLVSAERDGVVNTMTASWGGMGILWNKKVAFVFLRPQRYTKEFIDQKDCFTLSFSSFRLCSCHHCVVSALTFDSDLQILHVILIAAHVCSYADGDPVLLVSLFSKNPRLISLS